ncbi:MAG TPA: hypothetical protein P5180_03550 [Bacteroidales bacterium]|nr:hypothetical protein [Bacteroidales bacterium]
MKRTGLLISVLILTFSTLAAQNVDDALRYSQIFYNGTARFNSMGGAFTALGGDISSLGQNPAGIGVFRSSEFSISPQLINFRADTRFSGNNASDYIYDFTLGQAGVIMNLRNNNTTTGLVTLNFGYSYSRTNSLSESIRISGTSSSSSLLDLWAEKIDGLVDTTLYKYYDIADAYLGWYTYLLDTLSGTNDRYGTVYSDYGSFPSVYGQTMLRLINNNGYTGEHSIALGGNFSNKLYFGLSLGIINVEYENKYEHIESTDEILPSEFKDFNYALYYKNTGTGYSLKFGGIYVPVEQLRIGFSFHSPTLFRISEYVYDNLYTHINGIEDSKSNDPMWYKYSLTTPFRATVGGAFQLKKLGVISAEYEFADYAMARFSTVGEDDYDYTQKNDAIKQSLTSVNNFRVGAEGRIGRFYLRGGYGYYGKTYQTGELNENTSHNSFSLGAGFREQNLFVDFGFTTISNPQKYILYSTLTDTPVANMDINRKIFTVSFGYKFGY